jgi:putative lipoprotein
MRSYVPRRPLVNEVQGTTVLDIRPWNNFATNIVKDIEGPKKITQGAETMSTRVWTGISVIVGLLLMAAIACQGTPASPAPSQTATSTTGQAAQPLPDPTAKPAETDQTTSTASVSVTGTLAYRERIALGPAAVVEVKLADVSRADAPAIIIGELTIENPGQVPIAFEIEYDPAAIDARFEYAIQARITEAGELRFINTTRYSVITRGNPTHVDLVLQMAGATSPAPSETTTPSEPATVAVPAPVEAVAVSETDPGEYSLQIVSGLPGGCVSFNGYEVTRDGKTLNVAVTNLAPADPLTMCTMIYGRHEGTVELGGGFVAGETYTVVVNEKVTNSFVPVDPDGPSLVKKTSPVEAVEVVASESDPSRYSLTVVSRLPMGSSCSQFYGYDVARRFANTINVTVTHLEVAEKNVPCKRDLPVVVTEISLGSDFEPGVTYTVVVNDELTETFSGK